MPEEEELAPVASPSPGPEDDDGTPDDSKKDRPQFVKRNKNEKSPEMAALHHEELDWIFIGDADDARDASRLRSHNCKYVLNCTMPRADGGVMNYHEKDKSFEYLRLAMADNATEPLEARIEKAWDFLEKVRIREDGNVLVHCQQGVSRSVSMVVAYLIKYYRFTFDDAKALCQKSRKQACPNEGFENQLREMEEKLKATNGFEKVPPSRKRAAVIPAGGPMKAARGPSGPARGPSGPVGPPRGPAGPPRGPAGPPSGPARGPVGPAGPPRGPVGPAGPPSAGPSVGPAGPPVGPSVGPAAGPSVGPALPSKEKKDKKR